MVKKYFNLGCALSIYKPAMENIILEVLNANCGAQCRAGNVALHDLTIVYFEPFI